MSAMIRFGIDPVGEWMAESGGGFRQRLNLKIRMGFLRKKSLIRKTLMNLNLVGRGRNSSIGGLRPSAAGDN